MLQPKPPSVEDPADQSIPSQPLDIESVCAQFSGLLQNMKVRGSIYPLRCLQTALQSEPIVHPYYLQALPEMEQYHPYQAQLHRWIAETVELREKLLSIEPSLQAQPRCDSLVSHSHILLLRQRLFVPTA